MTITLEYDDLKEIRVITNIVNQRYSLEFNFDGYDMFISINFDEGLVVQSIEDGLWELNQGDDLIGVYDWQELIAELEKRFAK